MLPSHSTPRVIARWSLDSSLILSFFFFVGFFPLFS
jgi:hypothetical protein